MLLAIALTGYALYANTVGDVLLIGIGVQFLASLGEGRELDVAEFTTAMLEDATARGRPSAYSWRLSDHLERVMRKKMLTETYAKVAEIWARANLQRAVATEKSVTFHDNESALYARFKRLEGAVLRESEMSERELRWVSRLGALK